MNASVNKALVDPVLSERLKALNMETSDAPSPASTKAFVEAEIVKWRDVVEIAGANVD